MNDPTLKAVVMALSVVAVLVAAATALVVWRTAPNRRVNRRLAFVLALESVLAVFFMVLAATDGGVFWEGAILTLMLLPWAYLRFLAPALETPLVAPLRTKLADRLTILLPAFGLSAAYLGLSVDGVASWFVYVGYPLMIVVVAVPIFALVASFHAWRRAELGSPQRTRARSYLVAFAVRDLTIFVMWIGTIGTQIVYGNWQAQFDPAPLPPAWVQVFHEASFSLVVIGIVAYVPLLAYGVLKTQLFDIDIKIKVGIKATTLTAFFVVAFFAAEELGQALISQRAGPYVGLAGAGALALAFVPLRRVAERIANKTMPHVDTSEAYIAARRRNVYRAAVEGAFEDDQVTQKERAILTHLAAELLLDPREMAEIEEEVRERRVPQVNTHETPAASEAS